MTNGLLNDFNAKNFLEKVKENKCSVNTFREYNGKTFMIIVGFNGIVGVIDSQTEYYYDILVEVDGDFHRLISSTSLYDYELIKQLSESINEIITDNDSGSLDDYVWTRKHVQYHLTPDQIQLLVNSYFETSHLKVIQYLLDRTDMDTLSDLIEYENLGGFGLDCGWVWLTPINDELYNRWKGCGSSYVSKLNYPYNCQSTTCKEIQLEKAIRDLGLDYIVKPYVLLD